MVWMPPREIRAGIDGGDAHLVHRATDRIACDWPKLQFQQRLELP